LLLITAGSHLEDEAKPACDLDPTSSAGLQIPLWWLFRAYRLCRYHAFFCKRGEVATSCWHSLPINNDCLKIIKNIIAL